MKYSLNDLLDIKISIKPGYKIFLYWDLGSGKTSFVRKILFSHFNITDNVTSPTYIHYKKYKDNVYHFDLYRLENYDDFVNIWWEEILENPDNISFIEWPEILEHTYKADVTVRFGKIEWDEDSREVTIENRK
jgi:tRNA threonylcarbamoyladenosine biosynthesis protein TsaE